MTSSNPSVMAESSVASWREDFPILEQTVRGKPLVYLDNAATTHKPTVVIDAIANFYRESNSNVHRGVHTLSERATVLFEKARESVRVFLNAASDREVIFTSGTTDAVNLVAQTYGRANVSAGDEVLISEMEHHSNIVPWQMLCEAKGATVRVLPIDERGELRMDLLDGLLSERTKIVAVNHVSNALGTVNPVKEIIAKAHRVGAVVMIDGAQAMPHERVDVKDLDCDFYACSAHKVYGPTGIGALYGKRELLEAMPPWRGGGDMILTVSFEKTEYNRLPYKFEAGTPNIAGAIGFGAALDYVSGLGIERIAAHEDELLRYGTSLLSELPGVRMIGTAAHKAAVLGFVVEGIHPHDLGTILDRDGVAVRAGHHCAQPVMTHFGIPATVRASLGLYNRREELDTLVAGLRRAIELFA